MPTRDDSHAFYESIRKFHQLVTHAGRQVTEAEVSHAFTDCGVLRALGYAGVSRDVRYERHGQTGRSDMEALDTSGKPHLTTEFKDPARRRSEPLESHVPQIRDYMKVNRSRYGLITDGRGMILVEQTSAGIETVPRFSFSSFADFQPFHAAALYTLLRKPHVNVLRRSDVRERLHLPRYQVISLDNLSMQELFYFNYRFNRQSNFGRLVAACQSILDENLLQHAEDPTQFKFTAGAYRFWQQHHEKSIPRESAPKEWHEFLTDAEDAVSRLLFCMETAYAVFSRIALAKVCEDFEFKHLSIRETLMKKVVDAFGDGISPLAYPLVVNDIFRDMQEHLVESLFESDLFSWWWEIYEQHKDKSVHELRHELNPRETNFGEALGNIIASLYIFDYSGISHDLLGNLYQRYFDRTLRRQLGEFFTPFPIAELILDLVGYRPGRTQPRITDKRLLDPACGSGTFLVAAVRRFLREGRALVKAGADAKRPTTTWGQLLDDLCNSPRIAGFDIHPFSVMIAQINLMMELLPFYREAQKEQESFVLHRLPIFRTDSLNFEEQEQVRKHTPKPDGPCELAYEQHFSVPIKLPVREATGDKFLEIQIRVPFRNLLHGRVKDLTDYDYFCALQAVLDAAKAVVADKTYTVSMSRLQIALHRYIPQCDVPSLNALCEELLSYAQHIANEIQRLESEYQDGRLLKTIEDIVLASYLKGLPEQREHSIAYDFVVGNPPYVRKELIPPDYKANVLGGGKAGTFFAPVYHGDNDLYVYFLYSGAEMLMPETGRLGFIISGKFTNTRYGAPLRQYLASRTRLETFIDLTRSQIFSDATNYPVILTLSLTRGEPTAQHIQTVLYAGDLNMQRKDQEKALEEAVGEIHKVVGKTIRTEGLDAFLTLQSTLSSKGAQWHIHNAEFDSIKKAIETGAVPLRERFAVFRGVTSEARDVFVLSRERAEELKLEKELLRPVLEGLDVKRYAIGMEDKVLVFPHYKTKEGEWREVDVRRFPKTLAYLRQHKERLEKRASTVAAGSAWFALRPCRYYDRFFKPHLLVPDISDRNNFAYDSGKFLCEHTLYMICAGEDFPLLTLLGILNSSTLYFYHKLTSTKVRGGYLRYMKGYLDPLPIKLPSTARERDIAARIEERVQAVMAAKEIEQRVRRFPDSYAAGQVVKPLEMRFLENVDFPETPRVEKGLFDEWSVTWGGRQSWGGLGSEQAAQFVAEVLRLRGRVRHGDVVRVALPADLDRAWQEYQSDRRASEANPSLKIEAEIDELVFDLYGLSRAARRTIEKAVS